MYFLTVLETRGLRSRCQLVWLLVRAPPDLFSQGGEMERESSLVSSPKGTHPMGRAHPDDLTET